MPHDEILARIEACYDAIPRPMSTVEDVGPFSLFVADSPTRDSGWQFYARPRLDLERPVTANDVRRLVARQRELAVPRSVEWVHEVTPSLLPALEEAGMAGHAEAAPLLVLPHSAALPAVPGRARVLSADDPELALVVGAVDAAFSGRDDVGPVDPGHRRDLVAEGLLVVAAVHDEAGRVVGGGSAAPRLAAAELMGIAVVPGARRQGLGAAVTTALVAAVRERGADTVFLSAGTDQADRVYRSLGFVPVGTAGILSGD